MKSILITLFLITSSFGFAQQLVYTPVNPAFGGDSFNYTWLLNSANAQNSFSDPNNSLNQLDELLNLGGGLNNQFNGQQFGANNLPPLGSTTNGNLNYEVYESTQGLVINILDITTGEQTQIIIPN